MESASLRPGSKEWIEAVAEENARASAEANGATYVSESDRRMASLCLDEDVRGLLQNPDAQPFNHVLAMRAVDPDHWVSGAVLVEMLAHLERKIP